MLFQSSKSFFVTLACKENGKYDVGKVYNKRIKIRLCLGNVDLVRKRFNPKVKEYSRTSTGVRQKLCYGYTAKRGQSNKVDGSDGERKKGTNDEEKERRSNEMEKFHTVPPFTCNGR